MEEVLSKLKEAVDIKCEIAKRESALWLKLSEVLESYLQQQDNPHQKPNRLVPSTKADKTQLYLNSKEAAEYLGLGYGTICGWRFQGTGPQYIKMGGTVRYRIEDLDDFAFKNMAKLIRPYLSKK